MVSGRRQRHLQDDFHGTTPRDPDHAFAPPTGALNFPSERYDVFHEKPVDDVDRLHGRANSGQKLLVKFGILAVDDPTWPQKSSDVLWEARIMLTRSSGPLGEPGGCL